MKIAIVVGTRPEIIKLAPLIKEVQKRTIPFVLIHSNQHHSFELDELFFKDFNLPKPHYNLMISKGPQPNQIGQIVLAIDPILEKEQPTLVVVQGDANTTIAAALAANQRGIQVAHVEAGLRSFDKSMPEETNRILTDQLSNFLFVSVAEHAAQLRKENIDFRKIHVVGNTLVDVVESFSSSSEIPKSLSAQKYAVLTLHRSQNIDSQAKLEKWFDVLDQIAKKTQKNFVWPIHPRTEAKLNKWGISLPASIQKINPVSTSEFHALLKNASFVVTDSGGVQEEACIFGVPCFTMRPSTERIETLTIGANTLLPIEPKEALQIVERSLKNPKWPNPYGTKGVATKILDLLMGETSTPRKIPSEIRDLKICMIGLGYMGLPSACLMANAGFQVKGFDLLQEKVDLVNAGGCPFEEPGMAELVQEAVQQNGFRATNELPASDVYIIAVPTPEKDHKCDLSYVEKAARNLAPYLKNGDLVILESTVKPRTCLDILVPIFESSGKDVLLAHCPERAIPGNTLQELVHNDRIIGGVTPTATDLTEKIYGAFVKGKIFRTDATTAECVKLMENSFRDINIAFANELSNISRELNVDVWEAIALANRHPRVQILQPGPGVGGHCIAVDPWFLSEDVSTSTLIPAARLINDQRPKQVTSFALQKLDQLNGKKIGLLGIAYKKNVDDTRESPAEHIYHQLKNRNIEVVAYDPFVKEWEGPIESDFNKFEKSVDLMILVTDHDPFKKLTFTKTVIDTRNCLHETQFPSPSLRVRF